MSPAEAWAQLDRITNYDAIFDEANEAPEVQRKFYVPNQEVDKDVRLQWQADEANRINRMAKQVNSLKACKLCHSMDLLLLLVLTCIRSKSLKTLSMRRFTLQKMCIGTRVRPPNPETRVIPTGMFIQVDNVVLALVSILPTDLQAIKSLNHSTTANRSPVLLSSEMR